MHPRIFIATITALSLSIASLAHASRAASPAASLSGVVTEGGRAVLQSVTVTATDSRGHSWLFVTGEDGAFQFPDLPAGTYALAAELPGFRTVTVKGVTLSGHRSASVPLAMTTEPFGVSLMVTGSSEKSKAPAARRAPVRVGERAGR